ncbi:MAG: aspartate/tyrosine/aromatic aminotransferase [Pontiellaceae bacterium]|jgi:aspartate/tyrosine/aromatic aminotransferase|nr:aspartate/tyrosine/aromatic aminotransferase [Pontiellaceae bacterium]
MWNGIQAAPEDAILGLTEAFKKDPRFAKVNLGVGIYKNDDEQTPILESVRIAEKRIFEHQNTKSYMPIAGEAAYGEEVQKMIFGALCSRSATIHTPGGTGALRVASDVLAKFGHKTIWVSNPTWANHNNIFEASGMTVKTYPYYNASTKDLDAEGFFAALEKIPSGDCVLLHACCHNPSGVDLSAGQWKQVAQIARKNGWIALVDFAYQGLGDGLVEDRIGVETLLAGGTDFFIASSFSKNFGLYRERTGALTAVSSTPENAAVAMSHLMAAARVLYSNPPAHGGMIVTTILKDAELSNLWKSELNAMRDRIAQARAALAEGLTQRGVPMDCSFMTRQKGMFSFSGLSKDQVSFLRQEKAIYIVGSGRINVAGLTHGNMGYICDAVAEAMNR